MANVTDRDLLFGLLREAGTEAVTLDELEVVGVRDPAAALLALEEAGHSIHRVVDQRATCVRLAPFDGGHHSTPAPVFALAPSPPAPAAPRDVRPLVAVALALLVAVLLGARRR